MIEHPILVNRPIVCTAKGVKLCRPSEAVLDLLDRLPPGPFCKEDAQLLIDAKGRSVGRSAPSNCVRFFDPGPYSAFHFDGDDFSPSNCRRPEPPVKGPEL